MTWLLLALFTKKPRNNAKKEKSTTGTYLISKIVVIELKRGIEKIKQYSPYITLLIDTKKIIRQSTPTNIVMKSFPDVTRLKYQKNMEKNIKNIEKIFKVRLFN